MNLGFFREEVSRYERRVKKIRENPDPTKPKSNILYYELERDARKAQIEAWEKGVPFATGLYPPVILRAMGFEVFDGVMAADRTHGERAAKYFNDVRKFGLPEAVCDRTSIVIPMVLNEDCPKPSFIVSCNWECENIPLGNNYLAHHLDIPLYYLDVPFDRDDYSLDYVTDQFGELIEFAENNVPGVKYQEEKLIELQEYEKEWHDCYKEIYELRKRTPCPIAGREAFREPRWPCLYPEPARMVEYMKAYRDDLFEMADKGISAVAEEKLRVMWAISGPFYADPFKFLEERGVSIPYWHIGAGSRISGCVYPYYGDETEYGRKLTPLEEEARIINCSAWGGLGDRWIEDTLFICRDLKIDAIIYFQQWGCTVSHNLGRIVADSAETELGIPTLLVEGRMLIEETFDRRQFEERLGDFVDLCIEQKH